MDGLCKLFFIIIETIVNMEHETRHVLKVIYVFFKELIHVY